MTEALVPHTTAGVLSKKVPEVQSHMSLYAARAVMCLMVPASSKSELVIVPQGLLSLRSWIWISSGNWECRMYSGCAGEAV